MISSTLHLGYGDSTSIGNDNGIYNSYDGFSIDSYGRVFQESSVDELKSDEPEDFNVFISNWIITRVASEADGPLASSCVWPEIPRPVYLKRFDLYESKDDLKLQQGTTNIEESRRIRKLKNYSNVLVFFVFDFPVTITKEISIFSTTLPRRDKFFPSNRKNLRDLSNWILREKINGFIGTDRIPGTHSYSIFFQDSPGLNLYTCKKIIALILSPLYVSR